MWLTILAVTSIAILATESTPPEPIDLDFVDAYPCNVPAGYNPQFNPSGLTIWDKKLYTVSDRISTCVFCLEIDEVNKKATAVPVRLNQMSVLESTGGDMSFEGITVDGSGNFFLISENTSRVYKLPRNENDPAVKIISGTTLETVAKDIGLLNDANKGFEGISLLSQDEFILCAERNECGLVQITRKNRKYLSVKAWTLSMHPFPTPLERQSVEQGLADLFTLLEPGKDGVPHRTVFGLERNGEGISKISIQDSGVSSTALWRISKTLRKDGYRYNDSPHFAMPEGLAIDEDFVYVIIDNNESSIEGSIDENASKPLLFKFQRPRGN
jgi:hypothetical protein